jgi:N-methylhydantoinase A/oxoprolinase/acetone carboxylase beta subunit
MEGFRDVLEIGRGNRPDVLNFRFEKLEEFRRRAEVQAQE